MIFVALAVAWALYLIPKALSHHDEMAKTRSIESFSDSVRVLGKKSAPRPAASASAQVSAQTTTQSTAGTPAQVSAPAAGATVPAGPVARPATAAVVPGAPITRATRATGATRAAARRAAARRRRVLALLLLVGLVTVGLSAFAVTPWWSVAVPAGAILLFLVVARLTVRREQAARRPGARPVAPTSADVEDGREDTVEVPLAQRVAEVAMPLEDEGSLWDPLPMTLPTYVNKARARRTVRTIELTQVTTSGHDAADSALVAQAAEEAETVAAAEPPAEERKVAGA